MPTCIPGRQKHMWTNKQLNQEIKKGGQTQIILTCATADNGRAAGGCRAGSGRTKQHQDKQKQMWRTDRYLKDGVVYI